VHRQNTKLTTVRYQWLRGGKNENNHFGTQTNHFPRKRNRFVNFYGMKERIALSFSWWAECRDMRGPGHRAGRAAWSGPRGRRRQGPRRRPRRGAARPPAGSRTDPRAEGGPRGGGGFGVCHVFLIRRQRYNTPRHDLPRHRASCRPRGPTVLDLLKHWLADL